MNIIMKYSESDKICRSFNPLIGGIIVVLCVIVSSFSIYAIDVEMDYQKMIFRKMKNDKCYFVNINGEAITKPVYDDRGFWQLSDYETIGWGYIVVNKNGIKGIIDMYGREILPCSYNDIYVRYDMSETTFAVKQGKK